MTNKKFALAVLIMAALTPLSGNAAGKNDILGCWENRDNNSHVYLTRDEHFIHIQPGGDTLKGDWKFHPGPGTLELKYLDRAAVKLILKKEQQQPYFVDRNATMKLYHQGQAPCR